MRWPCLCLAILAAALTAGCAEPGAAAPAAVIAEARLYYNETMVVDAAAGLTGLAAVGHVHEVAPTHHVVRPEAGVAVSLIQRAPVNWTLDLHVVEHLEPGAADADVAAADAAARARLTQTAARAVPLFEGASGWRHDGVGPVRVYELS